MVPPEITTQNKKDSIEQVQTEPTTLSVKEPTTVSVNEPTTASVEESTTGSVKEPTTDTIREPNKVVKTYGHKTTGCKQGEYLPSNYCHKVSYTPKIIH